MSNRAWVTLATNDSYGLGALVLAHSLRRAGSTYPAVVLITPTVTEAMRDRLRAVFAEVVIVDVLDSKDAAHLALLQRPELGITFTKIHCWSLTQYEKCVFLDADTLIIQNCDELFEREELSAAPDVGWPDCFNSGVFVFKPSAETFDSLIKFAQERGSFDGGDQGLLNSYFSDWAHGDINKHLPFLYNVTSAAFYSYLPALKHYGQNLKIIHFIGATKPWLQQFNWQTRTAEAPQHLREFLQLWWDIFVGHVHSVLDIAMVEIEEVPRAVPPQEISFHTEPRLDYHRYEPILDPESEFPWHHPDSQAKEPEINVPEIDMTQFHDPWDIYRGNIPPNSEHTPSHHVEFQKAEDHEEMRKYAWDYISPQHHQPNISHSSDHNKWQDKHSQHSQCDYVEQSHEFTENFNYNQDQAHSSENYHQQCSNSNHCEQYNAEKNICEDDKHCDYQEIATEQSKEEFHTDCSHNSNYQKKIQHNDCIEECKFQKDIEKAHFYAPHKEEYVYCVHLDHEKVQKESNDMETETECKINGFGETDWEVFEKLRPRHPYDGFYLRHQMTIDSRGRKICTHEVPPTPTPSPPESPVPFDNWALPTEEEEDYNQSIDIEDHTGVAGNFARVVLGASAQQEALDDLTRRQGWEAGNIDYMGADAFDNIWAKITQTLSQPRSSPPKQLSPPPSVDIPAPVEVAQPVFEAPAPVATPAPVEAAPAVDTLAAVDDSAQLKTSVPAEPEPAKVPASVEAAPESLATKAPATEVVEAVKSEPVEAEKAAVVTAAPAAPEPTKVVAPFIPVEEPKPAAPAEAPVVEAPVVTAAAVKPPAAIPSEAPKVKSDAAPVSPTVVAAPVMPPIVASPIKPDVLKAEVTPEKGASTTDSPPLANTPSKEDVPIVPAAKSEERRKPACELRLLPPAPAADPLPTPDSEQEDAAALAHAIIASELREPATPASPPPPHPTPVAAPPPAPAPASPTHAGAVSLAQIGVEPKSKPTTAARIESSVAAADAPKKKVVKKVLKKEGATGEAPVPPPRKKEKKPKDK